MKTLILLALVGFFGLGEVAKADEPVVVADVAKSFSLLRYLEASSKRTFELRPLSVGFESTEYYDLRFKLNLLQQVIQQVSIFNRTINLSDEERMTLGLFGLKAKNWEDVINHYKDLKIQVEIQMGDESKRMARNIGHRWLMAALAEGEVNSFQSTDAIQIQLAGKLSLDTLKNHISVDVFAVPMNAVDVKTALKGKKNFEQRVMDMTESFSDLATERLPLNIQWPENLLEEPGEVNDQRATFTDLNIPAPEAGWPKNAGLVLFIRDSSESPQLNVPVRAFFKTFFVGKD